jgi:WD repeat-containing protein 35
MINNRSKSFVSGMKWSPDGTRICITYDDGAVIVGSVSGDRLWGKDMKHRLSQVEWSPDSKFLLFGTPDGEVRIYDDQGNPLFMVKIFCFTKQETKNIYTPNSKLAAIQWYEGSKMYTDETPPGLCIAFENGRI